jgi:tryptophan-rich sensory protein
VLIAHFWQTARPSSVLLWPYLGWVLFATYLNAGFYFLNRV